MPVIIIFPTQARKPKLITKAEAEFDYEAEQEDELNFVEGEIFLVLNKVGNFLNGTFSVPPLLPIVEDHFNNVLADKL